MTLSLVEVKEQLKSQLKTLLDVDEFKVIQAQHKDNIWTVVVEYLSPEKGPAGDMTYYRTKVTGMIVNDQDGNIEAIL